MCESAVLLKREIDDRWGAPGGRGELAYSRSPAASKRVGSLLGPGSFHNPVWVESLIAPSSWVVRQLRFRDAGEGPQAA
jgi:hypothetical protein